MSNVVYIKTKSGNEVVLIPANLPNSEKMLRERLGATQIDVIALDNSELGKVDGCLSCCSVLVE